MNHSTFGSLLDEEQIFVNNLKFVLLDLEKLFLEKNRCQKRMKNLQSEKNEMIQIKNKSIERYQIRKDSILAALSCLEKTLKTEEQNYCITTADDKIKINSENRNIDCINKNPRNKNSSTNDNNSIQKTEFYTNSIYCNTTANHHGNISSNINPCERSFNNSANTTSIASSKHKKLGYNSNNYNQNIQKLTSLTFKLCAVNERLERLSKMYENTLIEISSSEEILNQQMSNIEAAINKVKFQLPTCNQYLTSKTPDEKPLDALRRELEDNFLTKKNKNSEYKESEDKCISMIEQNLKSLNDNNSHIKTYHTNKKNFMNFDKDVVTKTKNNNLFSSYNNDNINISSKILNTEIFENRFYNDNLTESNDSILKKCLLGEKFDLIFDKIFQMKNELEDKQRRLSMYEQQNLNKDLLISKLENKITSIEKKRGNSKSYSLNNFISKTNSDENIELKNISNYEDRHTYVKFQDTDFFGNINKDKIILLDNGVKKDSSGKSIISNISKKSNNSNNSNNNSGCGNTKFVNVNNTIYNISLNPKKLILPSNKIESTPKSFRHSNLPPTNKKKK